MTSREFQERLARRARRASVIVNPELGARLETYYRLLATWNRKINLTALNLIELGPDDVDRLLIEPLVAARHVQPSVRRIIDLGSGGGSPALPLALAGPVGAHLLMVESKTRKAVFLQEAVRALELDAAIATARFEELLARPELHEAHDLLTIRAVRVEERILKTIQAFARPGGELFLFRGAGGNSSETVTPPLAWKATYPLVENLRSRLVVLEKRPIGHSVPRGTPH